MTLGPRSLLWRWAGDTRIGFLGGSIGLLQVMHPAIGAGVLQHSDFFGDPYGRVFRSVPWILGVVYDDPEQHTGRTVRDFHRDVKGVDGSGREYHALNPETYWWAHATFQYMTEQVADRFDRRRLNDEDREQLYQEGVEWYLRYGVSSRAVPPDRAAFQEKWDEYCENVLEMNPAAERVLEMLRSPTSPPFLPEDVAWIRPALSVPVTRRLMFEALRLSAIGGLPESVRRRFGIEFSAADRLALQALEVAVRRTWPVLPSAWRWQPRAAAAWRRVAQERTGGLLDAQT